MVLLEVGLPLLLVQFRSPVEEPGDLRRVVVDEVMAEEIRDAKFRVGIEGKRCFVE